MYALPAFTPVTVKLIVLVWPVWASKKHFILLQSVLDVLTVTILLSLDLTEIRPSAPLTLISKVAVLPLETTKLVLVRFTSLALTWVPAGAVVLVLVFVFVLVGFGLTRIVQVVINPSAEALITAVPAPTVLTTPFLSTVAALGLLLDQVTLFNLALLGVV